MHREMKLALTWNTPQRRCWLAFVTQKMQGRVLGVKSHPFTYPVVDPASYNTELLVKLCLWAK